MKYLLHVKFETVSGDDFTYSIVDVTLLYWLFPCFATELILGNVLNDINCPRSINKNNLIITSIIRVIDKQRKLNEK